MEQRNLKLVVSVHAATLLSKMITQRNDHLLNILGLFSVWVCQLVSCNLF